MVHELFGTQFSRKLIQTLRGVFGLGHHFAFLFFATLPASGCQYNRVE